MSEPRRVFNQQDGIASPLRCPMCFTGELPEGTYRGGETGQCFCGADWVVIAEDGGFVALCTGVSGEPNDETIPWRPRSALPADVKLAPVVYFDKSPPPGIVGTAVETDEFSPEWHAEVARLEKKAPVVRVTEEEGA